jgi:hypothetical protein
MTEILEASEQLPGQIPSPIFLSRIFLSIGPSPVSRGENRQKLHFELPSGFGPRISDFGFRDSGFPYGFISNFTLRRSSVAPSRSAVFARAML